jgi:hypothetical protein
MMGAFLLSTRAEGGPVSGSVAASALSQTSNRPSALGGFHIIVVDEAGLPLVGVELEGSSLVNPGPTASFCCTPKIFATAVTGRDGRAVVGPVPLTFRAITIRATFRDWPVAQWTGSGGRTVAPEEVRLVLGPAREVHGKVRVEQACPASQLRVVVARPWQEVAVNGEGHFTVPAAAPWTHLTLVGCGRRQDAELADFKGGAVELALPIAPPSAPTKH